MERGDLDNPELGRRGMDRIGLVRAVLDDFRLDRHPLDQRFLVRAVLDRAKLGLNERPRRGRASSGVWPG